MRVRAHTQSSSSSTGATSALLLRRRRRLRHSAALFETFFFPLETLSGAVSCPPLRSCSISNPTRDSTRRLVARSFVRSFARSFVCSEDARRLSSAKTTRHDAAARHGLPVCKDHLALPFSCLLSLSCSPRAPLAAPSRGAGPVPDVRRALLAQPQADPLTDPLTD